MTEIDKWEQILASEGLTPIRSSLVTDLIRSGLDAFSQEEAVETEFKIKEGLDDAITTENIFSSEIPLNKSGLPPCQRAKLENERSISKKDPRLSGE